MDFNQINDQITVSGEISLEDIAEIKARGFKSIINNRPDEEVPAAIQHEAMRAACEAAGLSYRFLPVTPGNFSPELIESMGAALDELDGPVFAYCRSGTRSCTVWGLAQAGKMSPEDVVTQAAGAGYDLRAVAAYLAR